MEKQLLKIPNYVKEALLLWAKTIELIGLFETRKISGYHDEPLLGKRKRQRSVRLNKFYRAIYIIGKDSEITLISVIEVNKHDY